jgi:hypothetical protein
MDFINIYIWFFIKFSSLSLYLFNHIDQILILIIIHLLIISYLIYYLFSFMIKIRNYFYSSFMIHILTLLCHFINLLIIYFLILHTYQLILIYSLRLIFFFILKTKNFSFSSFSLMSFMLKSFSQIELIIHASFTLENQLMILLKFKSWTFYIFIFIFMS